MSKVKSKNHCEVNQKSEQRLIVKAKKNKTKQNTKRKRRRRRIKEKEKNFKNMCIFGRAGLGSRDSQEC